MARAATRTVQDGHWPLINVASLLSRSQSCARPTHATSASLIGAALIIRIARADRCAAVTAISGCPPTAIWRNSVRIVGLPLAEPLPAPDASYSTIRMSGRRAPWWRGAAHPKAIPPPRPGAGPNPTLLPRAQRPRLLQRTTIWGRRDSGHRDQSGTSFSCRN